MEFGDRTRFGISMELDSDYRSEWLYGKFCYWINSIQVGDYKLGTSLRDVLFQMKYILFDNGNRNGGELCGLSSDDVYLIIDKELYGNEKNAVVSQQIEMPARFNVSIPVDIFNQWKVYLIECRDNARVMYSINASVYDFHLEVGEFDTVFEAVYKKLDSFYNAEHRSPE